MSADDDGPAASLAALRAQYERLLERLQANELDFRRLGRAVWRVQEDERRRLARDLHDGIGQNLTALKHRLTQVAGDIPPAQRAGLEAAITLCSDTLDDTRELSRLLRPPILDDLGLEPALRWLARSISESCGVEVELQVEPLPALDDELQTLLFRVAQEALNNASKHADAGNLLVRLVARKGRLQLQVVDDGRGCDPQAALGSGGSGLGGMRERLRLYGGAFEIQSSPGAGTRITASVPIEG